MVIPPKEEKRQKAQNATSRPRVMCSAARLRWHAILRLFRSNIIRRMEERELAHAEPPCAELTHSAKHADPPRWPNHRISSIPPAFVVPRLRPVGISFSFHRYRVLVGVTLSLECVDTRSPDSLPKKRRHCDARLRTIREGSGYNNVAYSEVFISDVECQVIYNDRKDSPSPENVFS